MKLESNNLEKTKFSIEILNKLKWNLLNLEFIETKYINILNYRFYEVIYDEAEQIEWVKLILS